jgi:uncharacterized membrane protein HdeD (DUF308 family)
MQENVDAQATRGNWWMLALRGVFSLIFGLIVLLNPSVALYTFTYIFAGYLLIDGIAAVTTAIRERGFLGRWAWVLLEGILGIIVGIVAFVSPGFIVLVLLYVVASWAIVTGIMQVVAALAIRGFAVKEWALGLAGLVSIIFGISLFILPAALLLTLFLWMVGIYGIIFGVLFLVRAFQWRSWASSISVRAS